jgi:hypothetical protein
MHVRARILLGRFTYANVMSTFAVFLVLTGGAAYAANTVFSTDIVDGEVKNADLANNSVTSTKIYNNSVTSADIRDDNVTSSEVLLDSLTSADLAADSVRAAEIDAGAVTNSELAGSAVDSGKIVNNSITAFDLAGGESNGAINLGAGFVATGRCRDVGISVGGALPGDAVLFSVNTSLPDGILLYGVRVSSADVVVGKVCNLTGAVFPQLNGIQVEIVTFRI